MILLHLLHCLRIHTMINVCLHVSVASFLTLVFHKTMCNAAKVW